MSLFETALKAWKEQKIDTAFLVFPYYYFDYDMSQYLAPVKNGFAFAIRGLNDFHNWNNRSGEIQEYVINYKLFGEKFFSEHEGEKFCKSYSQVVNDTPHSNTFTHIWHRIYEKTYFENVVLVEKLLSMFKENDIKVVFIVPPYYIQNVQKSEMEAVKMKRKRFLSSIREYERKIFFSS